MKRPTGKSLGSFARSTASLRQRARRWVIAIVCIPICCITTMLVTPSDENFKIILYTLICLAFIVFLGIIVFWIGDRVKISRNPEGSVDLFEDGLIIRNANNSELAFYQWDEVSAVKWPVERGIEPVVLNTSPNIPLSHQALRLISNRGDPVNTAILRLKMVDNREFSFNSSYVEFGLLLATIWKGMLNFWAKAFDRTFSTNGMFQFGQVVFTTIGLQKGNLSMRWEDISEVGVQYYMQRVYIVGKDEKGDKSAIWEPLGIAGAALVAVVWKIHEQHIVTSR